MKAFEFPYFDQPFAALAHRGGSLFPDNVGRENTLRAFRNAVELGYRYLETDVHSTSDAQLIAFHDDRLDRVSTASGPVSRLSLSQLVEVRIGGEPVPTMDELFETFPQSRFNIDIKASAAIAPLAQCIRRHNAHERVCVGSFSALRLLRFRLLTRGRVATSCGPIGVAWSSMARGLRNLAAPHGVAFQVPIGIDMAGSTVTIVDREFIRLAHRQQKVVHVWTIDDAETMHRLIDWGVDGIVSDNLEVLKAVAIERGLWN